MKVKAERGSSRSALPRLEHRNGQKRACDHKTTKLI